MVTRRPLEAVVNDLCLRSRAAGPNLNDARQQGSISFTQASVTAYMLFSLYRPSRCIMPSRNVVVGDAYMLYDMNCSTSAATVRDHAILSRPRCAEYTKSCSRVDAKWQKYQN